MAKIPLKTPASAREEVSYKPAMHERFSSACGKVIYMLAGFGLYSALLALPWQVIRPVLPAYAISAAEAADQADEERLQLMNEAAKRIKKPNLKEKSFTASLKSAK